MKKFIDNLKLTWPYVKDSKRDLIIYIIANIINTIICIIVPELSANLIIDLTNNLFYQLISIAIIIFFVEILRNLAIFFTRRLSSKIYRESFTRIQTSLGKEILKLDNKTIDANSSGVFIQRMTGDTDLLADVFTVLTDNLTSIITNVGIYIAVFLINKIIFIYLLLVLVILYFIENNRTKLRNEKDKLVRKEKEKVSGFVGEIIRGVRDIKMLDSESTFINALHDKVVNLNGMRWQMQNVDTKYRFLRDSMYDLGDLLLIFTLVYLITTGGISMANALVCYNYSGQTNNLIFLFGNIMQYAKDFNLSCERIFAIMNGNGFEKETFGTKHITKVNGDFEFKHVSFSYDNKPVLKDINFKIKANETVAFVGKSGAGKTTIFNLLCKMYDVTGGNITIDGIDIKELDRKSIRGNITIISQNPYIFNVSIKDNFRLVKEDVTDREIVRACKLACLHDYIKSLPDQYDTIIGEGGVNLSGGEKQRLAIARALVQKTEIILFDEATSALDNETQAKIQDAIDNMKNEYTILIIAHRLSTIVNCNRILFLNKGKIEAVGTHEELLKNSPNYKHLYESEIKHAK